MSHPSHPPWFDHLSLCSLLQPPTNSHLLGLYILFSIIKVCSNFIKCGKFVLQSTKTVHSLEKPLYIFQIHSLLFCIPYCLDVHLLKTQFYYRAKLITLQKWCWIVSSLLNVHHTEKKIVDPNEYYLSDTNWIQLSIKIYFYWL